jgi:mono/diheme cytochrome c family protein
MPARRLALVLLAVLPTAARGQDPDGYRVWGDTAIRARAILRKYCAECHGEKPTRSQLSVLDYWQVAAERPNRARFVTPGKPDHSRLLELIEDGAMPPGGRPRPTVEEVAALRDWVATKAPAYPKEFDDAYVLATIREDVAYFLARKKWEGGPRFRYLSLAHLVGEGTPDLRAAEQRLRDSLAASAGAPLALQSIDPAATVFRLDLRETAWLTADLFERLELGRPAGVERAVVPFDLLLLEYPFGAAVPPDEALGRFLADARQVRPVPFLRGDWVAEVLRKDGPLAADLKSLAELAAASDRPPPGPVPRPFDGAKPVRGPFPPFGAWYSTDVSAEPPPFALTVEVVDENGKPLTELTTDGRFAVRIKSSTDASFTVVRVFADGEARVQPVGDGTQLKAGKERLIVTDTGRPFLPGGILSRANSATEYVVVFTTDRELPDLTIIRSQHTEDPAANRYPIHRFLPSGKGDKHDPARVVRKVVPLKVVKPPAP